MERAEHGGWERSAQAWIDSQGEQGDFGRRYVLDAPMLARALAPRPGRALDVGCGEGRFCRMLRAQGVDVVGVEPTAALLARARELDPAGTYHEARAEALPFEDASFDLVVSYLTLIDIADLAGAVRESARVLRPGGRFLIANLSAFNTAGADSGPLHALLRAFSFFTVDRYLEERATWIEYRGIRILNHHRPLSSYMRELLGAGLELVHFDEPAPRPDAPAARAARFRRAPWFVLMEWRKPDPAPRAGAGPEPGSGARAPGSTTD